MFLRAEAIAILIAIVSLVAGQTAIAQNYPNRPIRLVVPFAPGGGTDIVARIIAQKASESLGQTVVVDNRAGGGGTIGAETAVRANADGYTLIMVSGSYGTNAAVYKLPYDPVNDIQPIVMIGESGFVVALHPSAPIKSVKELITHAKANPGKLNFASTGTGGITHLSTELLNLMANISMTHVPYKGTGPALNDLLGGQIQLLFGSMPSTIPHVKAGRLRGIGVSTPKRTGALPDMPTVGETVTGYEVVIWWGILGPKGLSKDIVSLWNKEVAKVLQTDEMRTRMAGEGIEPVGGSPEQFLNTIRRDVEKWKKVVKAARISISS
jgi:tripartite-type tricarboxylate transporter receptor subunit TctC